ncbi:hypothetical protein [Pedobacter arcticus]|uniref:hypothetical protein n=1 Tax=Pedobacter arcticus TaxID=752140 RepID=UPI0002D973BF|nr:hypothetical protein [Pedobacter arcticus]
MKKFILSAAIAALSTVAFAQNSEPTNSEAPAQATEAPAQDSSSTKVELTALPDAVKTTLTSDAYKAWTATEAFLVKENGKEYYQINVTKEEEKGSVKINADGTPAS